MPVATPSPHTLRTRDSPHSHTQTRQQRPVPTPRSSTARTPAPVSQTATSSHSARSPVQQNGRSTSPNYFELRIDAAREGFMSSAAPRANWSPPNSDVHSTAAASPRVVPLDQNPEFEAFRRQSESNGFNLGRLATFSMGLPKPPRTSDKVAGEPSKLSTTSVPPSSPRANGPSGGSTNIDLNTQVQRSPKRMLSSPSPNITDRPRRNSPASFIDDEQQDASQRVRHAPEEKHMRLSLPPISINPAQAALRHRRAETLPAHSQGDAAGDAAESIVLVTPQHVVNLLETLSEEILLLDLRVSTQYARARITGALNLCIPTTLLKRPSFNVEKLAETFKDEEQRRKFERWRNSRYIIVYDANSSLLKDATTCINTLKKFASEGWTGPSYVIAGGFAEFAQKFPSLVTSGAESNATLNSPIAQPGAGGSNVPPVIGGCPMPATKSAANPFFGNIRQNMDLIGGVGQMPIKHPASMTHQQEEALPAWLWKAADNTNEGRAVSEKFEKIERREQKRMQEALSGEVRYGTPGSSPAKGIQIAGIEKGAKNRYNNIWPYEHSRVKLGGVPKGGCDYINANHVKAAWSNKRYIATQGPIPATFTDFWSLVWHEDVRVIVMLTAEKEGGQVKAHNYWESKHYGPLHLNYLSEHRASLELSKIHRHRDSRRPSMGRRRSTNPPPGKTPPATETPTPGSDQPYVIVRRFTLSHADYPFERMREITQLQYSSWPDFGAPAHPAHLLGLVEQCDAVVRSTQGVASQAGPDPPNQRPVLVHCSAGCGRTGTFCTVDSVIDMLKRQRGARHARQGTPMDVDAGAGSSAPSAAADEAEEGGWVGRDDVDLVEKTVEDFRLQRLSMVQSLRQFVLCYESVLEWLAEQSPRSA